MHNKGRQHDLADADEMDRCTNNLLFLLGNFKNVN